MTNAGITSQYGFLYQRKVFIYYALSNAATNQSYTFEGKDDIEVSTEDGLFCIHSSSTGSIQVKSASIDEASFCKVICNWLLMDELGHHTLFTENALSFTVNDSTVNAIIDYICNGKDKKKSSIARRTYDRFKEIITTDVSLLSAKVLNLLQSYKQIVLGMDALDKRLEEVFFSNYCQDIKEYDLAKAKRLERFISYINQDIDNSIKSKSPYMLIYPNLIKTIMQVSDEISDERYVTNIPELKKKLKDDASRIVTERATREVKQLYLVDNSDQFVIDGIVHELLYKDFREVYITQKEMELINLEQDAHENYETALFSLDENDSHIARKVYRETVKMPIAGSLLPDGVVYRKGCYIYLTGDNIDEDFLITWGDENG